MANERENLKADIFTALASLVWRFHNSLVQLSGKPSAYSRSPEGRDSEIELRKLANAMPQLSWIAEANGSIYWYNDQWYNYTGSSPEEMAGWGWQNVHHPETLPSVLEKWTSSIKSGRPFEMTFPLRSKHGEFRLFLTRATPIFDSSGHLTNWFGTNTDVEDSARALVDVMDTLESMSDAFLAIDKNWKILRVNAHHEKVTGIKREEQIGKDVRELFLAGPEHKNSPYMIAYTKAMNERVYQGFEAYCQPRDLWTDVRIYPKKDGGLAIFFTDIGERVKNEKRLAEERDKLEKALLDAKRANQLKSAFLANMSHEIRTPLGAMMGFADLLRDPGLSAPERQSYTDILTRNGESLSVIINDILDLSKVEAGHLTLEYTYTYPEQVVGEVISLLRVKATEKDLVLEYTSKIPENQKIISDPTRLKQILLNLISNAIKFTPFGSVKIQSYICKTESGRDAICFEVADTGIGIPDSQTENIFQMFVQADGSMTRRFGGTGLGLSLSRSLARALGGDVTLVQTKEGFGTTFLVKIDDRPDQLVNAPDVPVPKSLPIEALPENALADVRILVVDDSPDNQQLIWRMLTKQGAYVESADNGLLGYRAALAGTFDAVVMDIQMPVMDGYAATQKLREAGYKKPIIALTAHAMSEAIRRSLNVGYTGHLTKPINSKELISMLARVSKPQLAN